MDTNYIITRLKATPYKYSTVDLMRLRLKNIDEDSRHKIVSNLKIEVWKECNTDIHEPLLELLHRMPLAS